jgi:uncharacterized Fe-S cluster-containing radical SAM superfamily protein
MERPADESVPGGWSPLEALALAVPLRTASAERAARVRAVAAESQVSLEAAERVLEYLEQAESAPTAPVDPAVTYTDIVDDSMTALRALRDDCAEQTTADFTPPHFPPHVQFQTIGGCNASCIMCAMSVPEVRARQRGTMSRELYEKLVKECAAAEGCEEISLYLQNEPLLDRDLGAKLALIKEHSAGRLRSRIVTNGSLLDERRIRELLSAQTDSVAVSLNAGTPETYRRVMGGLNYEKTRANIERLLDLAAGRIFITLTFVVIKDNEHEIEDALAYWAGRGVLCGAYGVNTQSGAAPNFPALQTPLGAGRPKECYLPLTSLGVLTNGDVILCCSDWHHTSLSGNANQATLFELWHAPPVARFRREATRGRFQHRMCANCLGQTRVRENLLHDSSSRKKTG